METCTSFCSRYQESAVFEDVRPWARPVPPPDASARCLRAQRWRRPSRGRPSGGYRPRRRLPSEAAATVRGGGCRGGHRGHFASVMFHSTATEDAIHNQCDSIINGIRLQNKTKQNKKYQKNLLRDGVGQRHSERAGRRGKRRERNTITLE